MNDPLPWRRHDFPLPGDMARIGRALLAEPAYACLWRQTRNWQDLDRAGFLVDALSRSERSLLLDPGSPHIRWISTPLPATQSVVQEVVLLSTGSFAPLHPGHIAMFDLAEKALASRGIKVLASYLSPSHDGYVSTKPGAAQYPASRRIHEARRIFEGQSAQGVDRLVDPWESCLAPKPLNFTTVIRRLGAYLSHHLRRPIRVVYLFGADNARFADVLHSPDDIPAGICVGRPGHDRHQGVSTWYLPASNAHASSLLRQSPSPRLPGQDPRPYLLRNEGSFAFQHWQHMVPQAQLQAAWDRFVSDVSGIISGAFDPADQRPSCVRLLTVADQRQQVQAMSRSGLVASMDPCTQELPGVQPVSITRYFRPAHGQRSSIDHGPRPGQASILSPQALAILKSSQEPVVLVDDDSATGRSMALAHQHLQQAGVRVASYRCLAPPGAFDIVDARDFLPGSFMAGLSMMLPDGTRGRLPYMAPFVDLSTRALLPDASCVNASIALWRAAAGFFKSLPVAMRVQDMHRDQELMFLAQGFAPGLPLDEMCDRFASALGG